MVALTPVVAVLVAAVTFGLLAMRRVEPPDPTQLAAIISPAFEQAPRLQPAEGEPKHLPVPEEKQASAPKNYDEAFDKVNKQLERQGTELVATRASLIAAAQAASSAFDSQAGATTGLVTAFAKMESSAASSADNASKAAADWFKASDQNKQATQMMRTRVDEDEHTIDGHTWTLDRHSEVLCGDWLAIGQSGHIRVDDRSAPFYFRDPVVHGVDTDLHQGVYDACDRVTRSH
jgi:hypothetical protein